MTQFAIQIRQLPLFIMIKGCRIEYASFKRGMTSCFLKYYDSKARLDAETKNFNGGPVEKELKVR